eukprot:362132-Chlamydomonas_euryale.AAC.5
MWHPSDPLRRATANGVFWGHLPNYVLAPQACNRSSDSQAASGMNNAAVTLQAWWECGPRGLQLGSWPTSQQRN